LEPEEATINTVDGDADGVGDGEVDEVGVGEGDIDGEVAMEELTTGIGSSAHGEPLSSDERRHALAFERAEIGALGLIGT